MLKSVHQQGRRMHMISVTELLSFGTFVIMLIDLCYKILGNENVEYKISEGNGRVKWC